MVVHKKGLCEKMAARLERKHYERAAVYAARGEWRKCASHVARAVAFGSMAEQAELENGANTVPFRTWKNAPRECVPTKTRKGLSRTTCAFRECEKGMCETDFTRCYLKREERKRGGVAYTCRGRYGATKKEEPGVPRTRTCTYSLAHGECKLDKSGDDAFENEGACTYQDGKCETDRTKAVEFAKEYFNRKGAEQAGIESAGRGSSTPASTRSPRPSPAKGIDVQIAEQERRGEEHEKAMEDSAAPKIPRAQHNKSAAPKKSSAPKIPRKKRSNTAWQLAPHNEPGDSEETQTEEIQEQGRRMRSHHKRAE